MCINGCVHIQCDFQMRAASKNPFKKFLTSTAITVDSASGKVEVTLSDGRKFQVLRGGTIGAGYKCGLRLLGLFVLPHISLENGQERFVGLYAKANGKSKSKRIILHSFISVGDILYELYDTMEDEHGLAVPRNLDLLMLTYGTNTVSQKKAFNHIYIYIYIMASVQIIY